MARKAVELDPTTGELQHTPDLVESSEVATEPTANGIPCADIFGKLHAAWIGLLSIASIPVAASGEVSSTKVVRADDARLGNPPVGGDLSGTAQAATVTKVQGRAFSNVAPADGQIPTWDQTAQLWRPATPAGGSALTLETLDGSVQVAGVTTIRVSNGTLVSEGGGAATVTTGGGGGGDTSPAAILTLFERYT